MGRLRHSSPTVGPAGRGRGAPRRRQQSKWWSRKFARNASAFDMIHFRRFPGAVFRFRAEIGVISVVAFAVVYLLHKWGLVCTNHEIKREIDRLCKMHQAGEAMGNLCSPLCAREVHSISCISQHSKQKLVFTAKWNQRLIVIKSAHTKERLNGPQHLAPSKTVFKENFPKLFARQSRRTNGRMGGLQQEGPGGDWGEKEFEEEIRKVAGEKLNITLTRAQVEELRFLEPKNKLAANDLGRRRIEMENILSLLQSQEYLLSRLFSDRDVFPQVLGTCGHLYGVEHLERPMYDSLFTLDGRTEWSDRMKLAVAIMDFVEEVETNFPDALYLCDVQMNHLGIAPSGRVKFLDLDLVYMKNIIETILRSGRRCNEHKDCDFLDCKSTCNVKTNVCDAGIANDNLQIICEKIFIGWTMSGKMIIPGLLMSEHTPASLSALLRLCGDNSREPVHEDLRQKLYTTLTEMHQILIQKLSSE